MQRVEPCCPDLLPLGHRLGDAPANGARPVLDPVEMRLRYPDRPAAGPPSDRSMPRRPVVFLAHAAAAARDGERFSKLLAAGFGAIIVLDEPIAPDNWPQPLPVGQVVALVPSFPAFYGGASLTSFGAWQRAGHRVGVLIGLAPGPQPEEVVEEAVAQAARSHADFIVAAPICLPAEERHRAYDRHAGEAGDGELENLLFHSDLGRLVGRLEQTASRAARRFNVAEGLPGPSTALVGAETFWAAGQLLLWARRLDALDDMGSAGWQLRRAARALVASRQVPGVLVAEDNLRVVPGFNPWVEAFARGVWGANGSPFEEAQSRWLDSTVL